MLKTFFNTYKLYLYAAIFVIYSFGIWHVATGYSESKCTADKLAIAQATLQKNADNQVTKDTIAKAVAEALAKWRPQAAESNRKIQNEIAKDPIYSDCKSSPSVMREYQNKLDNQPE